MTRNNGSSNRPHSPDEAFAVLGNETRITMLQELGEADGPLSFTELRNRVGLRQGTQFNYHLEKLVGHFVTKTNEGYALREPGQRVLQAVLSGAVTDDPVIDPSPLERWSCPYCGGTVEVAYREERLQRYCRECSGLTDRQALTRHSSRDDYGYLGSLYLPPAGVKGRSPSEAMDAAFTWGYAEWLVAAHGVCPRCSATVDRSVSVCEDHDPDEGVCATCDWRQAVTFRTDCTNCTFELESVASMHLAASPPLLTFLVKRGLDPLGDPWDWGWEYDEEILSTDPLEARFIFNFDGDAIELTVDDDLTVVDATTR